MKSKKIAASILAFSLITSAAASDTGIISRLIPTNSISASAAYETISSGDWEFEIGYHDIVELTKYTGSSSIINIPDSITDPDTNQTYKIDCISSSLFMDCKDKIIEAYFPSGIDMIPGNILSDATNLSQVFIPDGITKIGGSAFANTPNLKSITFPDTLEVIYAQAFRKSGLTSVTFPSSLKNIKDSAFRGTKITTVTLPHTLQNVDDYVFSECEDLRHATIRCSRIGCRIFYGNEKLVNVNISTDCLNSVFSGGALAGCPNLTKISNIQVLLKDADGKPYFDSRLAPYIRKCFASLEDNEVSFMNEYIDAIIKYVVKTETAGCTNDYQKVKKLHDWVCNKVDYAFVNGEPDPSHECHVDSSVFVRSTTVCDGYARALTLLLREAGFEAYQLSNPGVHAWTMVRIGDNYFHVDVCHDDKYIIDYDHYLKSDNDLQNCIVGHDRWWITKPTSRYNYDIPSELPVCQYSYSDINRGDVNFDGEINQSDIDLVQQYISTSDIFELPYILPDTEIADVNRDGEINIMDVVELARKIK